LPPFKQILPLPAQNAPPLAKAASPRAKRHGPALRYLTAQGAKAKQTRSHRKATLRFAVKHFAVRRAFCVKQWVPFCKRRKNMRSN
jgi:hypothetical protein